MSGCVNIEKTQSNIDNYWSPFEQKLGVEQMGKAKRDEEQLEDARKFVSLEVQYIIVVRLASSYPMCAIGIVAESWYFCLFDFLGLVRTLPSVYKWNPAKERGRKEPWNWIETQYHRSWKENDFAVYLTPEEQ